jgi:hypothetical protein
MAGTASAVAVAAGSFRTTVAAPGTRLHFLATDLNPHDCRPPRTPPCRVAAAPRSNRPARELLTKRHRRFGLSTQDPRSDRRTGSRGGRLVPHRTGRSDCRDDLTVGRPTSGSAEKRTLRVRIFMRCRSVFLRVSSCPRGPLCPNPKIWPNIASLDRASERRSFERIQLMRLS